MTDDRTPPHNLDAEKSVIGACVMQNGFIDEVAGIVQPPDFYRYAHQLIFRHILRLHERGQAVDLVTLKDALGAAGELDKVDGPAYVSSLVDGVPRSMNAAHYANIVREKATLRELIHAATRTLSNAYAASDDAATVLETAQQDIFAISAHQVRGGFALMADILTADVMPAIEFAVSHKRAVTGIPSGFIDLDRETSGWQNSDLIIVAGRPSMGKTSLLMDVALHGAMQAQKHTGVFSLEMSKRQLGLRAISNVAMVDGQRLKTGYIGEREWADIARAFAELSDARLHIDDTSALSLHEVRTRARRLKTMVGLDLLLLDYVQIMRAEQKRKSDNRTLELGAISAGLKALAKDLDIPIILLSQLSRALESRADKRPMLSDLRESGSLEQDADVVIFIYRDEVYNTGTEDRGLAELIIAKQRNGPTGTVKVGFSQNQTRFFNVTTQAARPA